MNRRAFLKGCSLGAVALGSNHLSAQLLLPDRVQRPRLKNWVWIPINTKFSGDDWKRSFALMRESGIRAILPEIYNGRNAYFASARLPVKTDLLGMMLPLARAEGLEVHAWMWCMPCVVDEILTRHTDWYDVNARGESAAVKPAYVDYYKFLDPARPEVRDWIQGTVKELAGIAELTGVHLDYIRYPDAILARGLWSKYNIVQDKVYPQYDYGYSQYSRDRFKKEFGEDPLEIKDAAEEKTWLQFRLDAVTALVNDYLVPAAHAKGKEITAAVFPGPSLAREMVRQDWGRWQLDAFLPMLYNSFYETGPEWVREMTREGVAAVKKPVYSGLYVHGMDAATFTGAAEMALQGGASGISIFSAGAMDEEKWNAFRTFSST